jgi:hypothetical protein
MATRLNTLHAVASFESGDDSKLSEGAGHLFAIA